MPGILTLEDMSLKICCIQGCRFGQVYRECTYITVCYIGAMGCRVDSQGAPVLPAIDGFQNPVITYCYILTS